MRKRYIVGAARCERYEDAADALRLAIERAGGLPEKRPSGVLVKANFLSPRPPQDAVTTHPEILRHIVREARRAYGGVPVSIADNPGYVFATVLDQLFETTGAAGVGREENVDVGTLGSFEAVQNAEKKFHTLASALVSKKYIDAGIVINAAKLKTHVETEMTGCIKNTFGIADTSTRKAAHRSTSQANLAHAIVDLYSIRPPEFNVLDAVLSMEGNGPSHGEPRETGWILAGANALAVDFCGAAVMGYASPKKIPLIGVASARGIGPGGFDEIEIAGATREELSFQGARKFKKSSSSVRMLPTFLRGLGHSFVSLAPELDRAKCVKCTICREVCPVDAIAMEGYPVIDRDKCVRCLCCHEMCPTGAMGVHRNIVAKLFGAH